MVTVRAFYSSSGRAAKGVNVTVFFDGFLRGHMGPVITNEDGDAHFDVDPGSGEVFVDSKSRYKGSLRGRVIVYL